MGVHVVTYAVSKKSAKKIADGMGAIKGAPCQVKSITPVDGGTRITLEWESKSGNTETNDVIVRNGRGISSTTIANGVLSVVYSDGTNEEIGRVAGKSAYEVALDNGFVGTVQEWLDSIAPVATKTVAGRVKPNDDFNIAADGTLSLAEETEAIPVSQVEALFA